MGYDIIHDGIPTIYDDLRSVDSSSDCPFISQALVLSFGNFGNYEIPFETQNKQAASYLEDENLKNRLASLYETDRNVKKGFLKSSQNESNVAEGILKYGKMSSENLPERSAIFFIKKCPNGDKNDATEPAIKKCISNKKEVSNGLVDGNKCSEAPFDKQEENNIQCIWKDPSSNVFQEGKGCYPSSKVLETLTKEVLPFF